MTRFIVSNSRLRSKISDVLPIADRTEYPPLQKVLVVVGEGDVYLAATDRYVILAASISPSEIEDPRRHRFTLSIPQLRFILAYLRHVADGRVRVRVTDVALTLDPESDSPLTIRYADTVGYPDVLGAIRDAFSEEQISSRPPEPKAYNPSLISHIKNVQLWATGDDSRPAVFSDQAGTTGVIMPVRTSVVEAAARHRDANPVLFEDLDESE